MVWVVVYQRLLYSDGLDGLISEDVVFYWFWWSDIRGFGFIVAKGLKIRGYDILVIWALGYRRCGILVVLKALGYQRYSISTDT
jgi:hypothetical protein